uniref:Neurogenic locus notch-like protein 1 n=1 Tax=Magallana gigas TaxID=29159 RepID=K1RNE9_MAGGI
MANINTGHLLLLTACYTIYVHSVPVFRDCGGRLTDAKGVIKSPNFPKEFPTPIQCEWVIYNPQTRNTAIYLTQFYLKGFVSVWQFEHYSNQREYINPRQLATLNANSEIQHIVSNKPYTVIRLAVSEINDINVRVLDHIVDVYGFNITYEFLDRSSTNLKRTCSINLCSYLGDCYANGDFSAYRCHCFEGYQGDICQYGEHCDPAKGINQCKNGGECRYFYGTNVNICNCTKGFTGHMCEVPLSDYLPDACAYLGCGQTCIDGMFGYKQCACYKDFRLNPDNRTCSHIVLYLMEVVTTEEGQHDSFWGDDYISYTIEGKFLTISCIVRGSENTSFRWFKDGMLIDMGVAVRKGFQTIINSKLDGTLRSVLYYGNVKASDRGEYTCEARDFGIAQNKSDLVDVITTPMVDIDPMADYVPYGGSIRIRCLSFDQDALQYEWYVNNLLIKRGRSDMIPETLQPAGSQLYVRRLLKRAIFTCKVTNAAGAQNVTADIYVQPGTETIRTRKFSFNAFQFRPRCFHDNLLQLTMLTIPAISSGIRVFCGRKWQAAITGRNDVQQKQGMEILRNGYRSSSLQHVFDQLFQYAASPDNRMYSGDVEIAANVLLKILQHLVKSPSLYYGGSKISFVAVSFGDNMIGILDALSSNLTSYLDFSPDTEILSDNIDVEFGSSSSHRVTLLRQNGERALVPDTNAYPVVLFSLRNLIDLFPMKIQRDHNLRSVSEMLDVSMFPSDSFVTDNLIGRISIPLLSSIVFPAVQNNFELLLVGAAVAISGLALILIILVVACRRLPGEESVIYVNFICVLIALNCVVIVCLYHWKTEIICTIGRYALFFLYSAALSFLLLVSVHQFISPSKAGGLVSKYLMFGWGCPLILTSFFVVASQMFDKSDSHSFIQGIDSLQVMFVFSVLSVKSKTIKADIATAANRRQLLCRCIKTGVLLMLVAMDAFLSMDLTPDPASIQLILLITCRIAIDEAEQSCKGCCSYFNHPTREQEKANKYYAEVNRAKYTAERKRHLSSLLGSSAAHELPLNNTEANSATVSCAETKIVDKPSQTTGPLLFIRANGSKEVAFVSERVPILNQNDTRIIGREVERLGVSAPNHSVRKNGYNRVNLSGQNSRSEPQEELTALIHSTADKEVQQHKQLL